MDVSIILINYHTLELLIESIRSISEKSTELRYEIIVIDNCSNDNSIERLQSLFGNSIVLIESPENLGFGKGNNLGAKQASGKYLFFLNPDTYLLNNAVKILADYLDYHPKTGAVGGNLYFPDQSPAPSFCKTFDHPEREARNATWRSILKRKVKDKKDAPSGARRPQSFNDTGNPLSVSYVFGADMMVRRDLFEELGGFDPDFFMYAEEEELSWRIKKAGYDIVSVPDAKIVHLEGASTESDGRFNEAQFRMRMNGKLLYYKKCFGEEGLTSFVKARKKQYKRLMTIAKLRGKDVKKTDAYRMNHCLEDEYNKLKECFQSTES